MGEMVRHKGYWCEKIPYGWKVRIHEFENGQRETLLQRRFLLVPGTSDPDDPDALVVDVDQSDTKLDEERRARAARLAAEKNAARAKRNCRLKIKGGGFNELLTLTYRSNQMDFDLMRKHFAAWLRKMRRAIPGFRAVYGFERQTRGAWHAHVACDRLPMLMQYRGAKVVSWKVGTALWREVVGANNGLCFVGGRGGRFNRYRSTAKIAGYVSKYLTKDHADGPKSARRWDSTQGLTPPPAMKLVLPECSFADAISVAWTLPEGHVVVRHMCTKANSMWLLYSEPAPG